MAHQRTSKMWLDRVAYDIDRGSVEMRRQTKGTADQYNIRMVEDS